MSIDYRYMRFSWRLVTADASVCGRREHAGDREGFIAHVHTTWQVLAMASFDPRRNHVHHC